MKRHDVFTSNLKNTKLVKQVLVDALMQNDMETFQDVLIAHLWTASKSGLADNKWRSYQRCRWIDALVLITLWALSTVVIWYFQSAPTEQLGENHTSARSTLMHVILALGAFAVVGLAATGLIKLIVVISGQLGIPEYILSFFGTSIGTSLQELAVEFTALRRNQRQLALGDVLGSCLVESRYLRSFPQGFYFRFGKYTTGFQVPCLLCFILGLILSWNDLPDTQVKLWSNNVIFLRC